VISGSAAEEEFKEREKEFVTFLGESRRIWLMFFLAIYAIPAIIFASIALMDAASTANTIWSSTEFQQWIADHHYQITLTDVQNYITYLSSMGLISGICALVSLICLQIRKYWLVAVIACAAATILCVWSIFGFIIGFIVTWMIATSKPIFEEYTEPAE
jgi:hypothetical protein